MEDHDLIVIVTALASALGLKEIWNIVKKKMDLSAKKDKSNETTKDKITAQVIEELKEKIGELERKIDELIKENIELSVKLARMEERLMQSAKKRAGRKRKATEAKEQ